MLTDDLRGQVGSGRKLKAVKKLFTKAFSRLQFLNFVMKENRKRRFEAWSFEVCRW